MVRYELYINGVQCDLSDECDISLIYESPIFADLESVQSDRSITIELPLTRKNREAIGNAARIDVMGDEPYIKLPAELYVDGVDIFRKGLAVIDEITDVISCTLIFGNIENFQKLGGTELREITMADDEEIAWNDDVQWDDDTAGGGVRYIRSDFGAGVVKSQDSTVTSMEYARPSAKVLSIIAGIEATCGVNISIDDEALADILGLWVPITGEEPSEETPVITMDNVSTFFYVEKHGVARIMEYSVAGDDIIKTNGQWDWIDISSVTSVRLKYHLIIPSWPTAYGQPYFRLYGSMTNDIDGESELYFEQTADKGTTIDGEVVFDTKGKNNLLIRVYGDIILPADSDPTMNLITGRFTIWGDFERRKVVFPMNIPVPQNLPDMTCSDFLQNLMNMYGLFALKSGENGVRLVSVRTLYDNLNEEQFVDWSGRLKLNNRKEPAEPDAIRYSVDDWAQVTTLDYDNDKDAEELGTGGEIKIDNYNIEEESDITVDFSASANKSWSLGENTVEHDIAVVPIWELSGDKYKSSKVGPRILTSEYTEYHLEVLVFPDSLYFGGKNGLVARRYAELQKVLNRAKVITVQMSLTPLDLRGLDWLMPVYLRQFGHYFALYRIQTDPSGISEVELIKL